LIAAIWADALAIGAIGRYDDFFALGGNSLLAARIAARVHDTLQVELKLADFAEHPSLAELARAIDRLGATPAAHRPQLVSVPRTGPLPMSFWQERTWKLSRTPAGSADYTMSRVYRISGPLKVDLLRECMSDLIRRHEILRTTFDIRDGVPVQIVQAPQSAALRFVDLTAATDQEAQINRLFKEEAGQVFDLTRIPLLRFMLVKLRDNEYQLIQVAHHIICDGQSWLIYYRGLAQLYEAKLRGAAHPLDVPPLQYADYAMWQRSKLDCRSPAHKQGLAWWTQTLSGETRACDFSFKQTAAAAEVLPADGMIFWSLEHRIASQLNALAVAQRVTRSTVRLAIFAALLASETGNTDVLIGMYVDTRDRLPLLNMIGYFSNLIALKFRYEPNSQFVEWLSLIHRQLLQAKAHSEIPYDLLRDEQERQSQAMPEIRAVFHTISHQTWAIEFADIRLIRIREQQQRIPWGLTMAVDDQAEENCVAFDPRLYDPSGVRKFVERYKRLLDRASHYPLSPLSELLQSA